MKFFSRSNYYSSVHLSEMKIIGSFVNNFSHFFCDVFFFISYYFFEWKVVLKCIKRMYESINSCYFYFYTAVAVAVAFIQMTFLISVLSFLFIETWKKISSDDIIYELNQRVFQLYVDDDVWKAFKTNPWQNNKKIILKRGFIFIQVLNVDTSFDNIWKFSISIFITSL
jgi:hypothetical protein